MMQTLSRIVSSAVLKHFSSELTGKITFFAESDPQKPKDSSYAEVRVNGPDSRECTSKEFIVYFEVSILISLVMGSDIYAMDDLIDTIRMSMKDILIIDGICAELRQDNDSLLEVRRFGQIDVALNMHQATVNGEYQFTFREEN